jgi:hypothetical protein
VARVDSSIDREAPRDYTLRTGYANIDEAPRVRNPNVVYYKPSDPTVRDATAFGVGGWATAGVVPPPFDPQTIHHAYLLDSYIHQSVQKYVSLILNRGWSIRSKNKQAEAYMNKRLRLLSFQTGITTEALIRGIIEDLILFGNAYLVKVRARRPNPIPGMKLKGMRGNAPIVGLFPVSPVTMVAKVDEDGRVEEWQQQVRGLTKRKWKPYNVIHLKKNSPRGTLYGISHLVPVLEDVRILRQMEQNVVLLVYRNLNPLIHAQVSMPTTGVPMVSSRAGQPRIDYISRLLEDMSPSGTVVTDADVAITVHGSESQALRADPYLGFFRERVFSGLAVSDTAMGRGSSTTRSTAEQLAADMHDTARGWQSFVTDALKWTVFFELLYELNFDPLNFEDDFVEMSWGEVDIDTKIKKETHATQLFLQNAITEDEMREHIGLKPLKDGDRKQTYVHLVTVPATLARAGLVKRGIGSTDYKNLLPLQPAGGSRGSSTTTGRPPKAPGTPSTARPSRPKVENALSDQVIDEVTRLAGHLLTQVKTIYAEARDAEEIAEWLPEDLGVMDWMDESCARMSKVIFDTAILGSKTGVIAAIEESGDILSSSPGIEPLVANARPIVADHLEQIYNSSKIQMIQMFREPLVEQAALEEMYSLIEALRDVVSAYSNTTWENFYTLGEQKCTESLLSTSEDVND